jgi:hypothetical protein
LPGVVFSFNESVSIAPGATGVQLVNRATGQPVDPSAFRLVSGPDADRVTVRFTSPLPDGDYRLMLPAGAFADAAGNPSAATTSDFFVLAADANHDRAVNFADLAVMAQNYNTTGKTFDQGDFNYDGKVDFNDLAILAQRYNTTLPPVLVSPVQATRATLTADKSLFSDTPVQRPPARTVPPKKAAPARPPRR